MVDDPGTTHATLRKTRERDLITEDETRTLWPLLGELDAEGVPVRSPAGGKKAALSMVLPDDPPRSDRS